MSCVCAKSVASMHFKKTSARLSSRRLFCLMQGVAALHETFVCKYTEYVKSKVRELAGNNKNWNETLGEQTASLKTYLEDNHGFTHATFKDSQVSAIACDRDTHHQSVLAPPHWKLWKNVCLLLTLTLCHTGFCTPCLR